MTPEDDDDASVLFSEKLVVLVDTDDELRQVDADTLLSCLVRWRDERSVVMLMLECLLRSPLLSVYRLVLRRVFSGSCGNTF